MAPIAPILELNRVNDDLALANLHIIAQCARASVHLASRMACKMLIKPNPLSSIPGNYTGLNVICIMYAALERIAPGQDAGFDIKAEYDAALKLLNQKP